MSPDPHDDEVCRRRHRPPRSSTGLCTPGRNCRCRCHVAPHTFTADRTLVDWCTTCEGRFAIDHQIHAGDVPVSPDPRPCDECETTGRNCLAHGRPASTAAQPVSDPTPDPVSPGPHDVSPEEQSVLRRLAEVAIDALSSLSPHADPPAARAELAKRLGPHKVLALLDRIKELETAARSDDEPGRCPYVSIHYGWQCELPAGHGPWHQHGDHGFRAAGARVPADEVTHACPRSGESVTSCCGRTPFELLRTDRMTLDHALVTCGAAGPAGDPETTDG